MKKSALSSGLLVSSAAVTGLAMALLVGCGELKKVDEMHDSTVKMGETTGQMNKTTSEMNDTTSQMRNKMTSLEQKTQELKQVTDELYDTLRQGNAMQLRRDSYDAILKAPTLFKKISEANKYMMAFEFQIWNNMGQDMEPEKRDLLAQQAAMEFFLEIEELAPRDNSINATVQPDPKDLLGQDNRTASFNAMAIALHQVNRKEVRAEQMNKGLKTMTLLSLIEEALLAPRGQAQKGAAREIMAHEDKAIQLLQTRMNVFPLIFIDSVTKLGEKNIAAQAKMALFGWEFDMDCLNATQLEYLQTEVLEHAVKAKKLLIKLGKKPEMDSTVQRLLTKMSVKSDAKKAANIAASQTKLLGLIAELKAN
ncbi:hypothetical protein [Bdellovibrio svalbardensis]|uniref:Lipoprotein n=1 Tax=Bdellovibrio svalbardensis TaxID=2972972 RepID=A0ABT6DN57_9BACT|nr:hypothetical protein [Bdellovibrio svalbardensis]MDG0817937.1 hypothetical protein [Bdellovibrio svalbardensis]